MKVLTLLCSLLSLTPAFAGDGFAQAEKTVIYEIPAPASLRAFSRFEMAYATRKLESGLTELSYTLPATLIGKARTFTFTGNYDERAPYFALTAADAEMNCVTNTGTALCKVIHHGVEIDLDLVKAALNSTSLSSEEKKGRLKLAAFLAEKKIGSLDNLFARAIEGGDLAGVMTYVQGIDYRNYSWVRPAAEAKQ